MRWVTDEDTRDSVMPNFGADELLEKSDLVNVAEYVLSLSGQTVDQQAAAKGATVYADNCAACHGETGAGDREQGAPSLTDKVWLYGESKQDILTQLNRARHGQMPAWGDRLDAATIKMLTVYVHSLGGGE